MTKASPRIGRSELEVLQYVADHHPIRVGEVAQHFADLGKARTTVLTTMERLRSKGHLKRQQIGGTWHYSPAVPKPTLLQSLVERFVDESLGGSVAPFVAYLAKEADSLSDDEIRELTTLVKSLKASTRDEQ